jgi:DNA-binding NtrC family response regulator
MDELLVDRAVTLSVAAASGTHVIAQFRLRVVAGPNAGTSFESRGERTTIGSHESADLVLQDPTVSRFHCELVVQGAGVDVNDLGSRNGTLVNGVSVIAAHIAPGAALTLGRSRVHFDAADNVVRVPVSTRHRFGLLVGCSRVMATLFATLERAAASDSTVLLEGETGTGKDAAAESIHEESARRSGPFVVVDCGSIPPDLIERELFGHERRAVTERPGALEAADGGTLFLDGIGELPLELQPRLLRALERRETRRVGGTEQTPVNVRIIAATNRNLRAEVNAGRFRSDLYYRLAVLDVTMPPLRDRVEDIPMLVEHILEVIGASDDPRAASVRSPELAAQLASHPWPGNVRELRNHVERCLAFETQLPLQVPQPDDVMSLIDPHQPLRVIRERWGRYMERAYLEQLLELHGDNVAAAARSAGVDRVHLHRLLSRCGLR